MTVRVPVSSTLLTWTQERSRLAPDELASRLPALPEWEGGTKLRRERVPHMWTQDRR